jgi:hypothetical protein
MGRKLNAAGAVIFGVLIVLSLIYTDANVEAVAFFLPWSLIVFGLEIAVFVYFLVGALWKRK